MNNDLKLFMEQKSNKYNFLTIKYKEKHIHR